MVIRACRAVTFCALCVCAYACACVSKRLTAGCKEGQSQSGSYSNAHCPLATLPSLSLPLFLGVSPPLAVILTLSTHSRTLSFSLHFTACLSWWILTLHTDSNPRTTIVFTRLLTVGLHAHLSHPSHLILYVKCPFIYIYVKSHSVISFPLFILAVKWSFPSVVTL